MTLIIGCVTEKYAIQVSDRRLTGVDGSIVEDNESKAVDWGGQVIFGYTGIARILGKPTDYWLSEALLIKMSPQGYISLNEAIESVRSKATRDFKKITVRDKKWKKLTIMGVGWIQLFDTNEIKPTICIISNCLDDIGNHLDTPEEEFKAKLLIFKQLPDGFIILDIGQGIIPDKVALLKRNIAKVIQHRDISPWPIARLIVETVRDVAEYNHTVGKNVLVASIPKESISNSRIVMHDGTMGCYICSSMPEKHDRTFFFFPEGKFDGIRYGPDFVLGRSWLRGFVSVDTNEQDWSVSVKTMRLEEGAKQGIIVFEGGKKGQFISLPKLESKK